MCFNLKTFKTIMTFKFKFKIHVAVGHLYNFYASELVTAMARGIM